MDPEGVLEELFRKCPSLEVVDLRHVRSVQNRTLMVLVEYCRHLKHIYLEGCNLLNQATKSKIVKRGITIDVQVQDSLNEPFKFVGQI